ncbi:MAG: hypothetical protein V1723_02005 [Candidatus Uhrbacteria bacterium]
MVVRRPPILMYAVADYAEMFVQLQRTEYLRAPVVCVRFSATPAMQIAMVIPQMAARRTRIRTRTTAVRAVEFVRSPTGPLAALVVHVRSRRATAAMRTAMAISRLVARRA